MDRNISTLASYNIIAKSLSARRAWIEMLTFPGFGMEIDGSLSARRAWIEMVASLLAVGRTGVALRKESVDRNVDFSRLWHGD